MRNGKIIGIMVELDDIDKTLLHLLQHDGKMTNKELAASIDITSTPAYERVRRLQRTGIISKYVALVNPESVGLGLHVFIHISIIDHSHQGLRAFIDQVTGYGEVQECHHVSGDADFILKVRVKNMSHYNDFVTDRLSQVPNVGRVRSSFSLSVPKATTVLHIE